jgi:hypothetical protein
VLATAPVEPEDMPVLLVPLDVEPAVLELVPLTDEPDEPLDPEEPDEEPEELVWLPARGSTYCWLLAL